MILTNGKCRGAKNKARHLLARVSLLLLLLLSFRANGHAQEYHMLDTEEAYTVGAGNLRTEIEVGVTRQPDASELISAPGVSVTYGLSEWADLEFEYEWLAVRDTDFTDFEHGIVHQGFDEEGTGDLRIKLKVAPYEFGSHRLGLQFVTKLPNAGQDKGLGTDETDFTWQTLLSSDWGRLKTHVNAGVAFLGDPAHDGNQNNYVVWGAGGEYALNDSLTLMGEVEGSFTADDDTRGSIDNVAEGSEGGARARVRAALTGPVGDWRWGLSAFKGVNGHTEDWGAQVGLSRTWGGGGPAEETTPPIAPGEEPARYYNPLKTDEAYTIGERGFRVEVGLGYVNQPDGSDLYIIPDLVFGWGIGPWAELEIGFQYLKVQDTMLFDPDGNVVKSDVDEDGVGDITVKLKASPLETGFGRLGAQFVTKVPDADERKALGTDEADFSFEALFSTDWSRRFGGTPLENLRTHVNAGMSIQSDARELGRQDDCFIWGIAAEYEIAPSLSLWAEAEGSTKGSESRNISEGYYGNSYAEARLGLTGPFRHIEILRGWMWGATVSAGLTGSSRDSSASIGLSRTWGP